MGRRMQFSFRVLLAIVLPLASFLPASFFAGMAVTKREANDLRSALNVEQESLRQLAEELMAAKNRIKELDGRANVASISADDLDSGEAVVIGHLGRPLKTMLNIRGTWQHGRGKDRGPFFQVTHVNGEALDEPVLFHREVVHVWYPGQRDTDDENKNGAAPSVGQSWEIGAYETGEFFDSPAEYKRDMGKLLPYMEAATLWRNFKLELYGVMRGKGEDVPGRR